MEFLSFRDRGIQSALLAARLHHARRLACRAVVTTTGVAVPGDPQHSYRNILKTGFDPLYQTETMAPAR